MLCVIVCIDRDVRLKIQSLFLGLHSSATRNAITHLQMPAMSPTMTEGGITQWKKNEHESFKAGDVLLEIVR